MLSAALQAIKNRDHAELLSIVTLTDDPDQVDKSGRTLLILAVIEGDLTLVETLLKCGASINYQDKSKGYSALHFAAQEQRHEIVKALIDAGSNLEARDSYGNTPLNRATFYSRGQGDTIKVLLDCGADPNNKNDYGVTPLSLAKQIANYNIVQYFR